MHPLIACLRPIAVIAAFVFVLVALSRPALRADDPGSSLEPEVTGRPGILVMRNGKVVDGRILKSGDDYTVRNPQGGIMFVPGALVSLHCESLRDAYRKLRDNAQKQNAPAGHCALARWCITNKLMTEARTELNDALQLEPLHEEARNLLVRLNELLDPQRPDEEKKSAAPTTSAPKATRFTTDDVESLGSLSREQALHFTRRIQPILVNNCAVAGCHGPESETGFHLQRVVPGGDTSRIASERNLAEVLEQIDVKSPRSSPLLTVPRGSHGRRGRPAFAGPRGSEQYEEIRKWVQIVARAEVAREKREGPAPQKEDRIEQVSGVNERQERTNQSRRTSKAATPVESRGNGPLRAPIDPFQVMRDPFDPELFNKYSAPKSSRR